MRLSLRINHIYRGWWLAGLGAVVMALGTVPLFQGMPVWNPVLRNAFGWTAGQMSWAFAVTRIEGGILGPLEGILIERLGPRRMVSIGLPILGAGFIFLSQTSELWHLYASFGIMSFGAALGGWLPMMTVMNHWFVRKKTQAMAVVMEGFAVGGIGIPFFLAWCIGGTDPNIAERFGWSTTSFGVGITIILFAFPLAWLIRNRPEEVGLRPDGDVDDRCDSLTNSGTSAATETELVGYSWQQAIRTRTFWLISFGHACSSIVIVSIMVHLGLLLDDRGYSLPTISAIVGTYTGVNAVFILIGGYLGDRVPIRFAAFGFSFIQSFAVVILVFNDGIGMAFLFAVVLGIGFGGRTPVTTSIRGVYFGRRAFAAITGMSMVPMNVMLFAAPLFAGYMRDATGSYTIPFLVIAIVCMFGSCLFLLLGNPPTFLETNQSSQSN